MSKEKTPRTPSWHAAFGAIMTHLGPLAEPGLSLGDHKVPVAPGSRSSTRSHVHVILFAANQINPAESICHPDP